MKRSSRFDDKLHRIRALVSEHPPSAAAELRAHLGELNGFLISEAAKAVQTLELRELIPDLCAAFTRLAAGTQESDRGCFGKKAILEALLHMEAPVYDVYLAGLRLIQKEYSFGDPVDTASSLRGLCAFALVQLDFRDALAEITPLLMDEQPDTRVAAADALAAMGEPAAAALLHLKAINGDEEPDVMGACYRGMLAIAPSRYLPIVSAALSKGEEAAAIALGESRLPAALGVLRDAQKNAMPPVTEDSLLLAMALLRLDDANAYLVQLVESSRDSTAVRALSALGLHRHDDKLRERLQAIVKSKKSPKLKAAFAQHFGD